MVFEFCWVGLLELLNRVSSVYLLLHCISFTLLRNINIVMINSSVREQYVLNEQVEFLFFVQRHFEWTYQSPSCCRWGVLVDHSSSFKAEVRRWKGQGGWWPHPCQCVLWEIPGKTFHTPSTLMLHNGGFRHVYTVLNLRFFSSSSCPVSSAPVLRQWRSDGGCLLHADAVEHEPN